MMSDKKAGEAREFARTIIPSIRLYGGWTSLDPMGLAFGTSGGLTPQEGLAFGSVAQKAGRQQASFQAGLRRSRRLLTTSSSSNSPYVRSERQGAADYSGSYGEVTHRGTDLSAFFIYRALRQWVKPGGTLAFIVPIGLMEAQYGDPCGASFVSTKSGLSPIWKASGALHFEGLRSNSKLILIARAVG